MGIIDYLLLIIFLVLVFFFYSLELIARSFAFNQHRFVFWVLAAISPSLSGTFIPLVLLVAIHLPISTFCTYRRRHQYQNQGHKEDDQKTVNISDAIEIPSHTTWDSPHSSYEYVPFVPMD